MGQSKSQVSSHLPAFRRRARVFSQDPDALKPHKRVAEHAHTAPGGHSFCVSPGRSPWTLTQRPGLLIHFLSFSTLPSLPSLFPVKSTWCRWEGASTEYREALPGLVCPGHTRGPFWPTSLSSLKTANSEDAFKAQLRNQEMQRMSQQRAPWPGCGGVRTVSHRQPSGASGWKPGHKAFLLLRRQQSPSPAHCLLVVNSMPRRSNLGSCCLDAF